MQDSKKSVNKTFKTNIIFIKQNISHALQDDEDGHLVVLIIIEELMSKTQDEFLDHFARLGVFSKVQALMGNTGDDDPIKSSENASGTSLTATKGIRTIFIYFDYN